ncbi:MAG: hypothetical protein ACMVO3_17950 [Thalassobaculum sp.]
MPHAHVAEFGEHVAEVDQVYAFGDMGQSAQQAVRVGDPAERGEKGHQAGGEVGRLLELAHLVLA